MTESRPLIDLEAQARVLTKLLANVTDEQLTGRTPCEGLTVGGLLDHFMGLTLAFRHAAAKAPLPGAAGGRGTPSLASLDPRWRELLPQRLDALAEAWRDPAAWAGLTEAGGVTLPGEVAGLVALNELLIHGWDLARSTGQPYEPDPASVEACLGLLSQQASDEGTPGLYGPRVPVPDDAPPIDRAVGLSGRHPHWRP